MSILVYGFKQFIFGLRVFFNRLSFRSCLKIAKFLFKRYILRKPIPFSVVFALTYDCQCGCIHCSVGDYARQKNDLSTEEVKSIIDFIDWWGPFKITFFGGEPSLRNDLIQLVKYASLKGVRVSIDTNGILLDEETIINLKDAGISNINISVDSSNESTHDALRKKQGCFQSAIRALELCVKHSIPCLISTYASKRAIKDKDLEKIIKLAKEIGVNGVKILFPILSGRWRESKEENLNSIEKEYVMNILDPSYVYVEDALEMLKKRSQGCSAIERNLIYISPYGDIQPCPAIPISFGNVRNESMAGIIKSMDNFNFFKKYGSCNMCLMNEPNFRNTFFGKGKNNLPIDVKEFNL